MEIVSVSGEKRKEAIKESEEEKKNNQFIMCKPIGVLFLISYWCSFCCLFKYPLKFVIHLVGKENSTMLIIGIYKRT